MSASAAGNATWQDFNYDATYSASAGTNAHLYVDFNTSSLAYGDFTAVDSWQLFSGYSVAAGDSNVVYKAGGGSQLSAFTRYDGGATVRFIVSSE